MQNNHNKIKPKHGAPQQKPNRKAVLFYQLETNANYNQLQLH